MIVAMNIGGRQQLSPQQLRRRRIGKKVLACNRIARVLERTTGASAKKKQQKTPRFKPTKLQVLVTSASIVVVTLVVGGGYTLFHNYQVEQQKQAAAANAIRVEAAEAKSAECRAKKAEEKADQIGMITYDELYDYKSCDQVE